MPPKPKHWLPENQRKTSFVLNRSSLLSIVSAAFVVLLPIGIWLYTSNESLNQVSVDYTSCRTLATNTLSSPTKPVEGVEKWSFDGQNCSVQFRIAQEMKPTVHFYIRITNFYQNHISYVKSSDPSQLAGTVYENAADIPSAKSSATTTCGYFLYANCNSSQVTTSKFSSTDMTFAQQNPDCRKSPLDPVILNAKPTAQYYPCGLAANSMFSDEFSDLQSEAAFYTFGQDGIAWPEDAPLYSRTGWTSPALAPEIPTSLIPPPSWRIAWPKWKDGYNISNIPDLDRWERYQVWNRKAANPTFKKLWGKNSGQALAAGLYTINITDTWDAVGFGGTKAFVIADVGVVGPRNDFVGRMFIAVACCSLISLVVLGVYRPREMGDLDLVSWKKE